VWANKASIRGLYGSNKLLEAGLDCRSGGRSKAKAFFTVLAQHPSRRAIAR